MVTGVWTHAAGHPLANATKGDSTSGSAADGSAATITANDFLTLLVTEMKNQDPTAATDPNQYISQLVQVNSLQQLIAIHQDLSDSLGSSSTSATGGVKATAAPQSVAAAHGRPRPAAGPAKPGTAAASHTPAAPEVTAGNLGIPRSGGTAQRIAEALSGSR